MIRQAVWTFFCILVLIASLANAESNQPTLYHEISCAGAPANAVTTLPEPFNAFAQIVCTNYGHAIRNRDTMFWKMVEGEQRPLLLAQDGESEIKPLGHQAFFTAVQVKPLDYSEQAKVIINLRNQIPLGEHFKGKVVLLAAKTNSNVVHLLYLIIISSEDKSYLFGMACSPLCELRDNDANGRAFIILKDPNALKAAPSSTPPLKAVGQDAAPAPDTTKSQPTAVAPVGEDKAKSKQPVAKKSAALQDSKAKGGLSKRTTSQAGNAAAEDNSTFPPVATHEKSRAPVAAPVEQGKSHE